MAPYVSFLFAPFQGDSRDGSGLGSLGGGELGGILVYLVYLNHVFRYG